MTTMDILRQNSINILLLIILTTLKSFASPPPFLPQSLPKALQNEIKTDPSATSLFATDFGNLSTCSPAAVFYPSSPNDIAALIRFSYMSRNPFTISQRGLGHSVNGQTFDPYGVLIDMPSLGRNQVSNRINVTNGPVPFVDAGGEQLWIDVLNATLKEGLTPRVFTDYVALTVGGTLSNAGISGEVFKHGPQISNVYEVDVITGKYIKYTKKK
jgi:cytokinin dehydrogenase